MSATAGHRILVVEDNRTDAMLIKAQLRHATPLAEAFTVEITDTFAKAMALLAQDEHAFAAVLLDLLLPDSDGIASVREMTASFPAVAVIVMTGLDDAEIARHALSLGAQDYLVKGSVNPALLGKTLRYAMMRQHLEQTVRESEAEHRALFEHNPQPIWVFDEDTLEFLAVNEAAVEHYGWTREQFLAMRVGDLGALPRPEHPGKSAELAQAGIRRHSRRDGSEIQVEVVCHSITFRGRRACLVLAKDITEQQRMLEALQTSERRYRDLFEMSLGLICEHDLEGRLLSVNPAAAIALGYTPDEVIGRSMAELIPPQHRRFFTSYLQQVTTQGQATGLLTVQHRDGSVRVWRFNNSMYAEPGQPAFVIGHAQDVTELARHEEQLRVASLTDPLTGAHNRRYLDHLARALTRDRNWGCVIVDLDHFKRINDTQGHQRGDEVLIEMVAFLRGQVSAEDTLVRMGGDEFLVLLTDVAAGTAPMLSTRLQLAASKQGPCAISVGAAVRESGETLEETIDRADRDLYQRRQARRGPAASSA